jgi:hypothetical protein
MQVIFLNPFVFVGVRVPLMYLSVHHVFAGG